jgi:hypothetical protein
MADAETPRILRDTILRGLSRAGDASARSELARSASDRNASEIIRELGISELERDGLTPEEATIVWGILRDPDALPGLRMCAYRGLRYSRLIKDGDDAYLQLMRDDASLDFRFRLARVIEPQQKYPAGKAVHEVAAEVRRLEAERNEARRRASAPGK